MNNANALNLGSHWVSIHVSLPSRIDEFVSQELTPFIDHALNGDLVKRVFFIRHDDGGPHIRLRVMPRRLGETSSILSALRTRMGSFAARYSLPVDQCSFVEQPYSRTALYFGDTWESIYSELINEQTSLLALRLMPACHGSAAAVVVTASALLHVLLNLTANSTLAVALQESTEFARTALADLNWTQVTAEEKDLAAMAKCIRYAIPRVVGVALTDPSIRHLVRLLKRARSRCANGDIVVTHSLHLLCNKLGVNLALEYEVCRALGIMSLES